LAFCGEVDNLGDLEATVTRTRPDIVLLDLELGDTHGVAALQHLQEVAPDVPALIYTAYADDELIMHAAELGVGGYLLKGCLNEELVRAIHTIHNGGTVLEPTVATRLIQQVHHNSLPESRKHKDLSKRETQVLACLVEGKTNRSIAETPGRQPD
jgi:DNA-binding NarL/FixJ family response regulator